jgi:hypothetical protein
MKRHGPSPVRALLVIFRQGFAGFFAVLAMAALSASPALAAPCESRAVHEMTVTAKAIIEAFYSQGPTRSY